MEFTQRYCENCKEPTNELVDGREFILRCTCAWRRALDERIKQTIHPQYWDKKLKDWNPAIFNDEKNGRFKTLINLQKAVAIIRLNRFCFNLLRRDPKYYALQQSIERGNNLFIRGPAHSGRGLLMAMIKLLAAMRDISATPVMFSDWAIFRSEILQSDQWGKEGDAAKQALTGHYRSVKLLTLENVRGEGGFFEDKRPAKKFRSAMAVDELLASRAMNPGSMIFSSNEFGRQIGDTVGDKIPEILTSDKTSLILMFSPAEAEALLNCLIDRLGKLRDLAWKIGEQEGKEGLTAIHERGLRLEEVKEALYIERLFPEILATTDDEYANFNTKSLHAAFAIPAKRNRFHADVRRVWTDFSEVVSRQEKTKNDIEYQQMVEKTEMNVVRACGILSSKMTDKEILETGKMMKVACNPADLKKHVEGAALLRETMTKQ